MLYPAPLRDLLIELASAKLFRAKWTSEIHEEWIVALLKQRPDLERAKLERTRDLMNDSVLDCLIEGYEARIPTVDCPDPNDRHLIAAAIEGHCSAIVTFNVKDFPPQCVSPYDLDILHPDEFIIDLLGLDQAAVLLAARRCRERLRRPALSAQAYISALARCSLPLTIAELTKFESVI